MLADVTFLQKVEMLAAQVTLHLFYIFKVETAAITPHDAPAQRIVQDPSVAFKVEVENTLNGETFLAMWTDVVDQMRTMNLLVIFKRVLSVEYLRTEVTSLVGDVELELVLNPFQPFIPPMSPNVFEAFPANRIISNGLHAMVL